MPTKMSPRMSAVAAVVLSGLLTGCQTGDPAIKRSERAAGVLTGTRETIRDAEQTVADSQTSLRALQDATGDLRPAFEHFVVELAAVRRQSERLRRDGDLVKNESAAYCGARQNDVSTISNDEMRNLAEQRTAKVREECEDIKDRYGRANLAFDRYVRSLVDLQTYLANELNYGSVRAGEKWFAESIAAGERLRGDVRALALKIELTSNMLSPVPVSITQWPKPLDQTDAVASRK